MATNKTIFRGSPYLSFGNIGYGEITYKAIATNVATITASSYINAAGTLVVISGVDSTIDGTHIVATIPAVFPGNIPVGQTFTYSTTSGNVAAAAVSPKGSLVFNKSYIGGTVTTISVINYVGTATTGAAHGLAVGDIVGIETTNLTTLGTRILSIPDATSFVFETSTQTVANASTTGAWTKIPAVYTAPLKTSTQINNIVITNKAPIIGSYGIYIGGYPIAENTSIAGGTTQYIDLEQIIFNGEKLIVCASNNDIKFHISGENV
jgi:hypothetical protein